MTRRALLWDGRLPLILAVSFVLLFWATHPHSYTLSDPTLYAREAHDLMRGHLAASPSAKIFVHRLGVVGPVAGFYRALGMSAVTTHLLSLLAGLSIVAWIWLVLPDGRSRLFGLFVTVTSVPLLAALVDLYPDLPATAWMMFSLLVLERRNDLLQRPRVRMFGALGASLWFAGFLCKETVVWILPIWAFSLIVDVRSGNRDLLRRFYVPALLTGAGLTTLYLLFCKVAFGSAFQRFSLVNQLANVHNWSTQNREEVLYRITTEPLIFFTTEYGAPFLLSALSLLVIGKRLRFWACSGLFVTGCFWLGSAALTSYQPLPLFARMALPCAPFFYLLSGHLLGSLSRAGGKRGLVMGLLLCTFVISDPARHYIVTRRPDPEFLAMKWLRTTVNAHPDVTYLLVCADERSEFLGVYFDFELPKNLRIRTPDDLTVLDRRFARVAYLYTNAIRSRFLAKAVRVYDRELAALPSVVEYAAGEVTLARAKNVAVLAQLPKQ